MQNFQVFLIILKDRIFRDSQTCFSEMQILQKITNFIFFISTTSTPGSPIFWPNGWTGHKPRANRCFSVTYRCISQKLPFRINRRGFCRGRHRTGDLIWLLDFQAWKPDLPLCQSAWLQRRSTPGRCRRSRSTSWSLPTSSSFQPLLTSCQARPLIITQSRSNRTG